MSLYDSDEWQEAQTVAIIEIFKDCGVMAGNPEGRREKAMAAMNCCRGDDNPWLEGKEPAQLIEQIARWMETTSPVEHLPGRLVTAVTNREAFLDVVDVSDRHCRKLERAKRDPQEPVRQENDEQRHGSEGWEWESRCVHVYQAMMHGDRMPETPTPEMVELGAQMSGHPCPKLAAHLLRKEQRGVLVLWNVWYRHHAFKTEKARAKALKAEAMREKLGFECSPRETETAREQRLKQQLERRSTD